MQTSPSPTSALRPGLGLRGVRGQTSRDPRRDMAGTQRGHKIPGMPRAHRTAASPEKDRQARTSLNLGEAGIPATKTKLPQRGSWRARNDAKSAIGERVRKWLEHTRALL